MYACAHKYIGLYTQICIKLTYIFIRSRDSLVGVETGWTAGVRFPAGARYFSIFHSVQTGFRAHPAFYRMSTGGFFPGGKATWV
jgi:hypothetical protein